MKPAYIAMPLNLGSVRYGVEQGPVAVWHELQERIRMRPNDQQLDKLRDLELITVSVPDRLAFANSYDSRSRAKATDEDYLQAIAQACDRLAEKVADCAREDRPLVVVGGDHAMVIGTSAGLLRAHPDKKIGMLYIDAHADMNIWSESHTKRVHGMAAAVAINRDGVPRRLRAIFPEDRAIDPKYVVQLGLHDLNWGEKKYLSQQKEHMLSSTMLDIECDGIKHVIGKTIEHFEKHSVDGILVSLDIDAIDPSAAPGTGSHAHGGLTEREAEYLVSELYKNQHRVKVLSFEIAEVNPTLDVTNKTAALAAKLICRFFGESII